MNEELIDTYVDRTGFSNDTNFVLTELNKIYDSFKKLKDIKLDIAGASGLTAVAPLAKEAANELNKVYDAFKKLKDISVGIGKVDGLADVAPLAEEASKEIDKMSKSNDNLANSTKKAAEDIKKSYSDQSDSLEELIKNEIRMAILATERAELTKNFNASHIPRLKEIKEETISLKNANQDLNRALKNIDKEARASEGSLNELRAQLLLAQQAWDTMSEAERKAADGQELLVKIETVGKAVKELEFSSGRFQRNVGNYQGSAKIIVDALKDVEKEISVLKEKQQGLVDFSKRNPIGFRTSGQDGELNRVNAQLDNAEDKLKSLNTITSNPQFLNIAGKVGDTNKELRFFARQLNELEDAGLKNSQVYKDVQLRLAQLTDQLGDTRAEIKALSSDTRSFDLFAGSVSFAADAFQTAAGAAVLFGASEEEAAKATKTLIAVQSVSNGLKGIANELTTKGTAANKTFAFVQGLVATSLDKSAAAATRAKAALGILGIIATVIGAIVVAYSLYNKKVSEAQQAQENLNDVLAESKDAYVSAVQQVESLRNNIVLAKDGFISKKDVVKQYNETIGKTTGEVKNLDEAEQALAKNAEAYIQFTLLKAAANLALGKAAEKAFEVQQKINESTRGNTSADDRIAAGLAGASAQRAARLAGKSGDEQGQAYTEAFNKALGKGKAGKEIAEQEQFTKIGDDLLKQAAELSKQFKFDFFGDGDDKGSEKRAEDLKKAALELFKFRQQLIIDENKKIAESDFFSSKIRIESLQKTAEAEKAILTAQAAFDLSQKGLVADAKTKIEEEYAGKVANINRQLGSNIVFTQLDAKEKLENTIKAQLAELDAISARLKAEELAKDQKAIDNLKENLEQRLSVIQISSDRELTALNNQFAKGLIGQDKYEAEKKRITAAATRDTLLAQIDYHEKLLKLPSVTGPETEKALEALAKLKKELSALNLDDTTNKFKESTQEIEKFLNTALDYYNKITSIIGGALDASATAQKNRIQEEIDLIDARTAKEIDAINQTTANKEDAANKIAILEARAAAQKQQLELRQRQIDQKRAQFEKAANIGRIVIEGALAVVHQLGSGDPFTAIPRAIVAGALAAAQLAVAIATPIPKFRTGKGANNSYEGPGIVGDGGRSELIVREDGSMEVTPDTPTMTWVGRKDIIHPDADLALSMGVNGMNKQHANIMAGSQAPQSLETEKMTNVLGKKIDRLNNTIKNKTENHFKIEGQLKSYIRKNGDSWTTYLNNNL